MLVCDPFAMDELAAGGVATVLREQFPAFGGDLFDSLNDVPALGRAQDVQGDGVREGQGE